jgi:hypothetical protein
MRQGQEIENLSYKLTMAHDTPDGEVLVMVVVKGM